MGLGLLRYRITTQVNVKEELPQPGSWRAMQGGTRIGFECGMKEKKKKQTCENNNAIKSNESTGYD